MNFVVHTQLAEEVHLELSRQQNKILVEIVPSVDVIDKLKLFVQRFESPSFIIV